MTSEPPTHEDLVNHPELAALHLLESALVTAERALLAAHPDLQQADFFPQAPELEIEDWIADAVLTHVSGLKVALGRYHAQLRRRPHWRPVYNYNTDF
jgi:hypothetical protein